METSAQHPLFDTLISLIRKATQIEKNAQRRRSGISLHANAVATCVDDLRKEFRLDRGSFPWGVADARVRHDLSHVNDFLNHPQAHAEDIAHVRSSLEQLMNCCEAPRTGLHAALGTLSRAQFQSMDGAPPRPVGHRILPSNSAQTLAEKLSTMESMVDQVVSRADSRILSEPLDAVSQVVSTMNDIKRRCNDNAQYVEDFYHLQGAIDRLTAKIQPFVDRPNVAFAAERNSQPTVMSPVGATPAFVHNHGYGSQLRDLSQRNSTIQHDVTGRSHRGARPNKIEDKSAQISRDDAMANLQAVHEARDNASEQVLSLEAELERTKEQAEVLQMELEIARQTLPERQQLTAWTSRYPHAQVDSLKAELCQAMAEKKFGQQALVAQVNHAEQEHQQVQQLEEELRTVLESREALRTLATTHTDQMETCAAEYQKQLQDAEAKLSSTTTSLAQVTAEYNAMMENSRTQQESWMQRMVSQQRSLMERHHEHEESWAQQALSREESLIESHHQQEEHWTQQMLACKKSLTDSQRSGQEVWVQKALSQEKTLLQLNTDNGTLTEEIGRLRATLARTETMMQEKDKYVHDMQREFQECDEKWVERSLQVERLHDEDICQMWHENAELREENFQLLHRLNKIPGALTPQAAFAHSPTHRPHCALAIKVPSPRSPALASALHYAPALTPSTYYS